VVHFWPTQYIPLILSTYGSLYTDPPYSAVSRQACVWLCVGVHIHGNMATTGRLSHINFSVLSFRPVKLASSSSPWRLPAPQIWPRLTMRALQMFFLLCCIVLYCIVSEHEFTFTFAICYRPCVCLSSVTFVHSTQPEEIFGNVSTPFSTLTIHWTSLKILRR